MRRAMILIGGLAGVGLVVLAIWLWQGADEVVMSWRSRRTGLLAVWSAAAACTAAGQLIMLKSVAERFYPVRGRVLSWALVVLVLAGSMGALGFGMAAR